MVDGASVLNVTLQSTLVVMLGSALGGGARLWVSTLVARLTGPVFPWGTLFVNIAGCLVVGVAAALLAPPGRMHGLQDLRLFLITGFLGGFTPFSAFALETVLLFERGQTFAGYIALYTFGRIFFEAMRSDPASRILGVRFNLLLSALLCVFGAILWVVYGRTQPVARASEHGDEKEPVPLGDAPDPPA